MSDICSCRSKTCNSTHSVQNCQPLCQWWTFCCPLFFLTFPSRYALSREIQNSWKMAADEDELHAWHSLHFVIHFMQHITSISLNGMTLHAYPTLCTYASLSVTKIKEKTAGHDRWACWNNTWLKTFCWSVLFNHTIVTSKMQNEVVQRICSSFLPFLSTTSDVPFHTKTLHWNQRRRPVIDGTHRHDHLQPRQTVVWLSKSE